MKIDTGGGWKNLGYQTKMGVGKYGLLPCVGNGSDTTYYCDALWANSSNNRVALCGGATHNGSDCGAFACPLNTALSSSYWPHGASPSRNMQLKRKNNERAHFGSPHFN